MLHQIPTHKPSKLPGTETHNWRYPSQALSVVCPPASIALKEARCELVARTSLQLCRSHTCAGLCAWRAKFKLASLEPGQGSPFFPCYAYRVRGVGGGGGERMRASPPPAAAAAALLAHFRNHVRSGKSVPVVCFNLPPGALSAAATGASVSCRQGGGRRGVQAVVCARQKAS